jgi:hypothetical protein
MMVDGAIPPGGGAATDLWRPASASSWRRERLRDSVAADRLMWGRDAHGGHGMTVRWRGLVRGVVAQFAQGMVGAADPACGRSSARPACCRAGPWRGGSSGGRGSSSARRIGPLRRPPSAGRAALVGELAGGARFVRLGDGDVESGEADGVAGGGEAAGVAELGRDRTAGELADAEVALPGQAAGVAAAKERSSASSGRSCSSMWSIMARPVRITLRAESGSSSWASRARRVGVRRLVALGTPWWKSWAWTRCCQAERWSTREPHL